MEDGSYFHELHRMNPAERKLHRASLKSFLDHHSFNFPQIINHNEGYSKHDSVLEDEYGRKCTLKYTLEHSEFHVFRSLDSSDVVKIEESTDGDTMTVFFSSEELAKEYFSDYISAMSGSKLLMLTGSEKWGLRRSFRGVKSTAHPILAEVSKLHPLVPGETSFTVDIEHMPIQSAFKNADIQIDLKLHHEDYDFYRIHTPSKTSDDDDGSYDQTRHRRLGWSSWVSKKWKKVKKMASKVASATVDIVQTAADLASGSLDESTSSTVTFVNYNYDTSTGNAVSSLDIGNVLDVTSSYYSDLTCTECYAYAATTLHISMKIASYELRTAEIYVSGDLKFKMEMSGTMGTVTQEWEKEVFAWTSPTVSVMIGVIPMTLQVETPVSMSLDVTLTSSATFSSSLYASVTMKSGYRYSVDSSPNLQQISENSVSYGGSGLSFDNICDATASVQFAITPMAQLIVSFVGGPNVAVKLYTEAIASTATDSLAINAGYEGTIGGKIEVELTGYGTIYGPENFGPIAVVKAIKNLKTYNGWVPVASGCESDPTPYPTKGPTASSCPATCDGQNCDYWVETCSELENTYGCDCTGCDCDSTEEPTPQPTTSCYYATCFSHTCDYWVNYSYTCSYLETQGCDCTGCDCGYGYQSYASLYTPPSSSNAILPVDSTSITVPTADTNTNRRMSSTAWDVIGQTWFGTQTTNKECDGFPESSQLTAQLVVSGDMELFVYMSQYIGVNDFDVGTQGSYAGTTQSAFYIQYYASGAAAIIGCYASLCDPDVPDWQEITYTNSTHSSTSVFPDLAGYFYGETMQFSDPGNCIEINLYTANSDTPVPTKAPTESPTQRPTTKPTSQPHQSPVASPTVEAPTSFPVPLPTILPIPTPSSIPSPKPTNEPINGLPTKDPSFQPTSFPTIKPSPVPSMVPTTTDTTSVEVSFNLGADADPTYSETEALRVTIADQIDIPEDNVKDLVIESISNRRRGLLSAYTWQLSFRVEASLAVAGVDSAPLLADKITTSLESSAFQTAVAADVPGAVVVTSSITSTPISPTGYPTKMPSPIPRSGSGDGGNGATAASTTYLIIGVSVVFVVLIFCGLYLNHRNYFDRFTKFDNDTIDDGSFGIENEHYGARESFPGNKQRLESGLELKESESTITTWDKVVHENALESMVATNLDIKTVGNSDDILVLQTTDC
jgi:hypothetical protein